MKLLWTHQLSHFVNSVAISDDGQRVAAGTYYFPYPVDEGQPPLPKPTEGRYGTFFFDAMGRQLWHDEFNGNEGIYAVAVSGRGDVVAAGGLLSGGKSPGNRSTPNHCLVRAYAADGTPLLDYSEHPTRVNCVALDHDATVLAAAMIDGPLLVFRRDGGAFAPAPTLIQSESGRLDMVAVHPDGGFLIAAGYRGTVHMVTLDRGLVQQVYTWQAGLPELKLLACALARRGELFVAGGTNKLFVFSKESMMRAGGPEVLATFDTLKGGTSDDLRWLAMSGDGSLISIVQNLGHDLAGALITLRWDGKKLIKVGKPTVLRCNPNSTSIDVAGTVIAVADGHPVRSPGTFYLFRASDRTKLMELPTADMNWPLVISADGSAMVGGSDAASEGNLFYFSASAK